MFTRSPTLTFIIYPTSRRRVVGRFAITHTLWLAQRRGTRPAQRYMLYVVSLLLNSC